MFRCVIRNDKMVVGRNALLVFILVYVSVCCLLWLCNDVCRYKPYYNSFDMKCVFIKFKHVARRQI